MNSDSSLLTCARYAYVPNRLGFCGPDKSSELTEYIKRGEEDKGLVSMLSDFETMYPYLRLIAGVNKIENPLRVDVVRAYFLGNKLINSVTRNKYYRFFIDEMRLKDRLEQQDFLLLENKLRVGALPIHNFHVFNIFVRTGKMAVKHTLETMDKCRIAWGKINRKEKNGYIVDYQPLEYKIGQLVISPNFKKLKTTSLEDYEVGDIVTLHWEGICEKIEIEQLKMLNHFTLRALKFANINV